MAKKNDNKTIILAAGGALLLFGLFKLFGNQDTDTAEEQKPSSDTTQAPTPKTVQLDYSKILANGSKGNEVAELQKLIGVTADGVFGPKTEAALISKYGIKSGSLTAILKIIQDKKAASATQSRKNEIVFKYPYGKKVIASKDINAKIFENRGGTWLDADAKGNQLPVINIKRGMDVGKVIGTYEYNTPWIIVEISTKGNYLELLSGKKIILKGDMIL